MLIFGNENILPGFLPLSISLSFTLSFVSLQNIQKKTAQDTTKPGMKWATEKNSRILFPHLPINHSFFRNSLKILEIDEWCNLFQSCFCAWSKLNQIEKKNKQTHFCSLLFSIASINQRTSVYEFKFNSFDSKKNTWNFG